MIDYDRRPVKRGAKLGPMKHRTQIILAAADDPILQTDGICFALLGADDSEVYDWFSLWFNNTSGFYIGPLSEVSLDVRYTFLAMAAAVSETEY